MNAGDAAGLYVHVPFCLTRCGYCDFNTYAGLGHLAPSYVAAVRTEANLASSPWRDVPFVSLFFGGGTPTTLPPRDFVTLLDHLRAAFHVDERAEVSVESNPDTVDAAYLRALRRAGVTRLSFGVQSFDPEVLAALERIHAPASARAAFRAGRRAGFDDVNLDLIYGANGETLRTWERTLRETIALRPEHVSAYALTIEPATALGRKVAAGLVPPPDPDLQADMYDLACDLLGGAGYEHYEVSNWATPGHRCVHNLGYWEGRPYLGLGAGAHSYRDDRRWWNVRPPTTYIEGVAAGRLPVGGQERLDDDEGRIERLLLGLRLAEGVPHDWVVAGEAALAVERGLAVRRGGRLALTERGMFVANDLVLRLAG
jgi:oxygen-independent coproporphyrinogen-3 oxidase